MRTSITALLLMFAALAGSSRAAAQTPPPPAAPMASGAAAPAAPAPAPEAPAPAAPPAASAPMAPMAPPAAPPAATPPAGTPPAAPATWYDKFAVDAFVDAYGSFNYNMPKPQGPIAPLSTIGGNAYRALDVAEGFSVNWLGVNASYTADPIGGTVGLRFGPGAVIYHAGTSDAAAGLAFVKQAYATWKATDKLTLDFGKFDQPYGSEVADSQLNMNYTRTLLWWYMQPLYYTGLRASYAVADQLSVLAFVANGWNNSIDINRSKAFGVQVMLKPMDSLVLYAGYVGSPEQADTSVTTTAMGTTVSSVANANDHWRHMVDLVADFNPTKELRFLLNVDYRAEDSVTADHSAVGYGGNLVVRYSFTDAFYASLRGEYFHDEHGDLLGTGQKTNAEDGTLTLAYGIGTHLALMLDNRIDVFDIRTAFYKNGDQTDTSKTQVTTTLGVIASTK
jgi:putative OmpL-like beta-barrel porin-2